ncbi:PREDICTED: phylloplanin-like [Brassica oleracea var. oleracea]|uniref:phylloplanin-like n=1 Tax=Brassica oleracea var. oleracea TaxID=109376 RepID=UPI0006A71484|nr:PREDICTED: phylloplanin-like [Brassica oleracea var. oleracea]
MAMLRNKNITFSLVLMCLIVASPIANAQLGGLGGGLGGLGGLLGGLTSIFNIQGLLMCSVTGTVSTNNTTAVPPFPNNAGQNVSSTTTNAYGVFSIPTIGLPFSPSTLLSSGCRLVVTTPLTACNVSLPAAGLLMAPLSLVGIAAGDGLNIFSLVPSVFGLVG